MGSSRMGLKCCLASNCSARYCYSSYPRLNACFASRPKQLNCTSKRNANRDDRLKIRLAILVGWPLICVVSVQLELVCARGSLFQMATNWLSSWNWGQAGKCLAECLCVIEQTSDCTNGSTKSDRVSKVFKQTQTRAQFKTRQGARWLFARQSKAAYMYECR